MLKKASINYQTLILLTNMFKQGNAQTIIALKLHNIILLDYLIKLDIYNKNKKFFFFKFISMKKQTQKLNKKKLKQQNYGNLTKYIKKNFLEIQNTKITH